MNYQEQLNPWVINQLLPDLTRSLVMRFRRRVDAESYLKVVQQMRPQCEFAIVFEHQPAPIPTPVVAKSPRATKTSTRKAALPK